MDLRKEIDEKLHDIEDKEKLEEDSAYIQSVKNNIKNTSIKRLEELRREFLNSDFHLDIKEINLINKVFNFLKEKA